MQSNMKRLTSAGVTLTAVLGIVLAAEAQTPSGGLTATVAARITPTRRNDHPGGSAVASDLVSGESKRLNLTAGRNGDLCHTGVWAIEPGVLSSPAFEARIREQEASALYVWHFDVGMREVATDRIVFDLFWERISRSAPNDPLRGKQRLALREGQSYSVDLIHGSPSSDCVNVVVDIIAHIHDDAALQVKTLEWDLWFSAPQSGSVHRTLTSPHGQTAAFQFEPVAVTVTLPGGKANNAMVDVYGELRGRLRPDGSIDVAFTAHRGVNSSQNRMRPPRLFGAQGKFGQKNFVVKPGEAVKIVLPPINVDPLVQFRTDPVTGDRTARAVPRPTQPASSPGANEMSITVQARVR